MSRPWVAFLLLLGLAALPPGRAQEPLGYAEQLIRSGEYALAQIALEKQLAAYPAAAARLLSEVYLLEGELDRAQHWLERARQAGLTGAAYYAQKGRIESARARWAAAWAALRSAVALDPRPEYALLWGVAGLAQSDAERALLGLQKAQRSGSGPSALYLQGLALLASEPERALELLLRAEKELAPDSLLRPQAAYWQARALERLGRVKEARSTLRFLLRNYPDYAAARDELNRLGP